LWAVLTSSQLLVLRRRWYGAPPRVPVRLGFLNADSRKEAGLSLAIPDFRPGLTH
jgi:hypothetical protein